MHDHRCIPSRCRTGSSGGTATTRPHAGRGHEGRSRGPACRVLANTQDEGDLTIIAECDDQGAYEMHFGAEHTTDFLADVPSLIEGELVSRLLTEIA